MTNNTMKKIFMVSTLLTVIFSAKLFAETICRTDSESVQKATCFVERELQLSPYMYWKITQVYTCDTKEEVEKAISSPIEELNLMIKGKSEFTYDNYRVFRFEYFSNPDNIVTLSLKEFIETKHGKKVVKPRFLVEDIHGNVFTSNPGCVER